MFEFSFANVFTTVLSESTILDTFVIIVFAESSGDKLDMTVPASAWFVVGAVVVAV